MDVRFDAERHLPKHRQLELALLRRMRAGDCQPHDLFLSQEQICREFGVNLPLARRALANLEEKGVLYKINGKGTFISPPVKQRKVVLVMQYALGHELGSLFEMAFLSGFMLAAHAAEIPLLVTVAGGEAFMSELDDVTLIYPDLAGVVFVRGPETAVACTPTLAAKGIPTLFYGSDCGWPQGAAAHLYHEDTIVDAALGTLTRGGHTRIAIVHGTHPVNMRRAELAQTWLAKRGMPAEGMLCTSPSTCYAEVLPFLQAHPMVTACYCVHDLLAVPTLQAVKDAGRRVPGEIAVLGTKDLPVTALTVPALSSVRIPVQEDAQHCLSALLALTRGAAPAVTASAVAVKLRAST